MAEIDPQHLSTLFICASRYAYGRATYIVAEIAAMTKAYWDTFHPGTRAILKRDLGEALDEAKARSRTLGMQMDQDVWEELLEWMEWKTERKNTLDRGTPGA